MKKRPTKEQAKPAPRERLTLTWWIVAATLLIVPLIFDVYGKDNFRLPKELAFRASAIVLLIPFAFWATRRDVDWLASTREHLRDPAVIVTLAVVAWTAIATLASLNRGLSVDSFLTVVASAIFFLGCRVALRHQPLPLLDTLLLAAIVNSIVALSQSSGIWQPFRPAPGGSEIGTIALLGNSNDVGSFLVFPAVATVVGATSFGGKRRMVYLAMAIIISGGLIASFARTAISAFLAAIVIAAVVLGGRARLAALVACGLLSIAIAWPGTELGRRYWRIADSALLGSFQGALSGRLPGFLAALEMWKERPIIGTGPGTFKWLYMKYRLDLSHHYPMEWIAGASGNFAEVHNDHLQIAAETGLVGYLLFLGAVVVLVRGFRSKGPERIHNRMSLPIAVAAFTLMLAQFPLQLAAPRMALLFLAAFCTRKVSLSS